MGRPESSFNRKSTTVPTKKGDRNIEDRAMTYDSDEEGSSDDNSDSGDDGEGEDQYNPQYSKYEDIPTDDSEDEDEEDDEDEGSSSSAPSDSESDSDSDAPPKSSRTNKSKAGDDGEDGGGNSLSLGDRIAARNELGSLKRKKFSVDPEKANDLYIAPLKGTGVQSSKRKAINNNNKSDDEEENKRSKHKPKIVSSSRKEFFARGAPKMNMSGTASVNPNMYKEGKAADPRFNDMSGTLRAQTFEQGYSFLADIEKDEISRLKTAVKASNIKGRKGQKLRRKLGVNVDDLSSIKETLSTLQNQRGERERELVNRNARIAVKRKLREGVEEGKGAYHLKRSDMRKAELEARFEELKKKGGEGAVKKAIEKKRKKNRNKDHKLMPARG